MFYSLHLPARIDGVQAHLILQVASPSEDYLAGNSGLVSVAPAFRRASLAEKFKILSFRGALRAEESLCSCV
jgi:hypothetical protein